jgi:hypothetical protein
MRPVSRPAAATTRPTLFESGHLQFGVIGHRALIHINCDQAAQGIFLEFVRIAFDQRNQIGVSQWSPPKIMRTVLTGML